MPFGYTPEELDALDLTISKDRLDRYLRMGKGDRKKVIQFYEMNNTVSESLFGVIRGFEVALRNSYHRVLTVAALGRPDWYEHFRFDLNADEQDSIDRAKKKIRDRKLPVVPGRVIALLGMGFWCGITARCYDARFWVHHLHKAYPHKRIGRKEAWDRLEQIRGVRNRIAHHETILHLDLAQEHGDILETIEWMCPLTKAWVEHNSTMMAKLQDLANLISASRA